jgi:acetyl-CoA synthetase
VVDTWWQTENGMILVTPLPGITTLKPGSATKPFIGVQPAVYDEDGHEIAPGQGAGYMVIRQPWPAMLRGLLNNDQRYRDTYWSKFPNTYLAGDGARVDADGDFWMMGRIDDVMNVSGHRLSTIEIESALVSHPDVAQAAVVSRSDPTTGQAIVAYVTLRDGAEASVEKLVELREHVGTEIGPIAKPANVVFSDSLPMTRSGKIMRRLLKDIAENRELGDTTTLADPSVVNEIQDRAASEKEKEKEA